MWCCVCVCVLVCACGVVCACVCCGVCVLCVLCGVSVGCVVCCFLCVHVHVVLVKLGTRKTPCVYVQNASVCTVRTSPCVPATGPHVLDMRACCRYTRRRPDRIHGGVLNVHTGGFSLLSSPLSFSLSVALSRSFFPLLFSCLVSLLTCLFFCTHRDEIRQTSDSTNYERPCTTRSTESREELSICQSLLCHILGIFRVLRQIRPQAPLLVGLIFMFNVLSALTGFRPRLSQEILCIAKLMTANSSAECPTPHMRRICSMAHIHNTCNIHCLLSFLLDENILGK